MAHIRLVGKEPEFESPTMVEGLPGVGLVGKIAADHLVDTFDMRHYANVHCDGVPRVAVYAEDDSTLRTPVRLYADEAHDLIVLQSDVPISPSAAHEFASCFSDWFAENGVTPIYLSGLPREKSAEVPSLYGVGVAGGTARLDDADIGRPDETGLISGPTGALLNYAVEQDVAAIGLVVESDPKFPDPEGARVLIKKGLEPLTGFDVPVDDLVEHAEEIRAAKERLAKRMQEAEEDSSQARPLGMYQ